MRHVGQGVKGILTLDDEGLFVTTAGTATGASALWALVGCIYHDIAGLISTSASPFEYIK